MVRFGGFYTPFGGFGPFFRGGGFERGDMKHVILYLLADKPRHGYDIIKEMESRFCGFYSPSPGTVYPTLQMSNVFMKSQTKENRSFKSGKKS